jgi:copper ion binding protein
MKYTIRVSGMHCPSCVMRIEGLEDELLGIQKINASYQKGEVQVEFDENCVSLEQILTAMKSLGYGIASP